MSNSTRVTHFQGVFALLLLAVGAGRADTINQISDPASQKEDSKISWSQLGATDQTALANSINVSSNQGLSANLVLFGSSGLLSVVCSAAPPAATNCSWTGTGLPKANRVVWTTDGANGGNGPVTVSFARSIVGAGALIQSDTPGQFTASLQAFNGQTSLGSFTSTSDAAGDAVYLGVNDMTGPNITSVVFSLTSCTGTCTDFALDDIHLNAYTTLVSLSAGDLVFTPQLLNTTSPSQQVTLTNPGNVALTISGITSTNTDFAQTNTCGTGVAAGGSCIITVTYTPTKIGLNNGTIILADNSQNGGHRINLTGTGTEGQLSAQSLNFATQAVGTTSATQSVTLTNIGTTVMHVTNVTVSGMSSEFGVLTTCIGAAISPGNSCYCSAAFTPAAIGLRTASILITDDGGKGSPEVISLSGTGQ